MNIFLIYNNKDCRKKVVVNFGFKISLRYGCNRFMLLENCYIEVNVLF